MNPETEFREGLEELASTYHHVLELLGEDPSREGLQKTPMRVAKAMQVLTRGYTQDAHKVLTDALFAEEYDQMVIVKESPCGLYPQRIYHRSEQNSARGGHLQPPSAGAGTVDTTNKRLHRRHTPSVGRDGRS